MTDETPAKLEMIHERLAGQHLLVTGSTGFLAKVFLEKLLRSVPTLGSVTLLVRPRAGGTPKQRVFREVLRSRAFDRLRASLGDGFWTLCEEKVDVVGGDLTLERLGLDDPTYQALNERITLIVNSAATVTFDEQLDLAIQLNTLGPTRLIQFARDCGNVPYMHVSTCYVCGVRQGVVVEDLSAPEQARETLPRDAATGEFDLHGIVSAAISDAAAIKLKYRAEKERCRQALIEAGMQRARSYGWNDTYTFTKWLGEQLLVRDHGKVPVVIFRPAIIEGSYEEPTPGWIDGLRMADPLIVAYGRGKLKEFPARLDVPLDFIPVDFVANAMMATLPVGVQDDQRVPVYHCSSSGRQPLYIREVQRPMLLAFRKRPMYDDDGRPIELKAVQFVEKDRFIARWRARQRRIARTQRLFSVLGIKGRRYRKLSALSRQIEQLIYFAEIYSPYTHLDCHFADDALRDVMEKMHPDDRARFPFDVESIDWSDYLINRHIPGLRSFVLGTGSEPTGRIRSVDGLDDHKAEDASTHILSADNLFEAFERAAERFHEKPALQIRRNGRWVRYSFDDVYRATGTIMRRFQELGLVRGDRVAICGESGPEWGLVYMAIMRAGMTAIPLDPQLPAKEAWACTRFAKGKLLCATSATAPALSEHREEQDAALVTMSEPFVPPPGASRDQVPDPAPADATAIASILFTSGTTVAAKAVALTHRNFLANAQALLQVHRMHHADELLSVLPMYHAFEFTGGFLLPLLSGATITYVCDLKGPEIRSAMQSTGTTVMLVVPRLLRSFMDGIENQVSRSGVITRMAFRVFKTLSDLTGRRFAKRIFRTVHRGFGGRLRMLVSGGSHLDAELHDAFDRMGFAIYEGYGLTETSPVLALNPPGMNRCGSVGKALSNVDIEIRHQNLEGVGEVWVRGPSVMSGYLDNPAATAEVMDDGWLGTGDLGRLDGDGYLYLTGRSKDLIVTGAGKNVYPDEVESHYRDLPHVRELCVFGMESEDGIGDEVHAVVVIDESNAGGLDRSSIDREIRMAVEEISFGLPTHQRIGSLHFWERELPKTSTMKAKRGMIRDLVRPAERGGTGQDRAQTTGAVVDVDAKDDPIEDRVSLRVVREIVSKQTKRPESAIARNSHLLLDLGVDSIGKIDLLGEVEARFDMRIDDDTAATVARVSDLVRVIGHRKPVSGGKRDPSSWRKRIAAEAATKSTNGKISAPLLPVRWLLRGSVRLFLQTYVRVHTRGRENIPKSGAFILAPNHASHLDSPSVLQAVGGKRRIWIAGAEDYFFNTRVKRFVFGKVLDTISFDRQADGVRGLRRCGDALTRGDGLLIFPEGTRSISGELQSFKIGVSVLAMERGVPIIPVHIDRAYDLFPKGARFVRPGAITVSFGQPIVPPSADETEDHYEAFKEVTAKVEAAVVAMSDGASG